LDKKKRKIPNKQINKPWSSISLFKDNPPSKVVATTQKGHPFGSPFRHTTPTLMLHPAKRKPVGVCLSTIILVVGNGGFQPLAT